MKSALVDLLTMYIQFMIGAAFMGVAWGYQWLLVNGHVILFFALLPVGLMLGAGAFFAFIEWPSRIACRMGFPGKYDY